MVIIDFLKAKKQSKKYKANLSFADYKNYNI
jgi:hypothetical protein